MKRAVFVLVALLVYGGFENARHDDNPYSHAHEEAFVAGCERGGSAEPPCRCAFAYIKQNVSVADYKAYVHLITSPGYTAAQTPMWMTQAIAACVPAANG